MPSPRSRNLENKVSAKKWIHANGKRSNLFLKTIRILESGYGREDSGFVDKEPPEYRFNRKRSGGYVIIYAKNDGVVSVDLQIGDGEKWAEKRIVSTPDDIDSLIACIQDCKILGFDFQSKKNDDDFELQLKASILDSKENRQARLKKANPQPKKVWRKVAVYLRNPDVVAEVLDRADGICEKCGDEAPFIRSSNNTPYLEVHHSVRLSDGGDDTIENAVALCPNCHREVHLG